ncbi:MAG: hypothetical protein FRX49_13448 [Trebouxia sp. A1-2]|nr:MAG: hypothetical protein FRX49_13448 [Trebouxia sp. A1-2]
MSPAQQLSARWVQSLGPQAVGHGIRVLVQVLVDCCPVGVQHGSKDWRGVCTGCDSKSVTSGLVGTSSRSEKHSPDKVNGRDREAYLSQIPPQEGCLGLHPPGPVQASGALPRWSSMLPSQTHSLIKPARLAGTVNVTSPGLTPAVLTGPEANCRGASEVAAGEAVLKGAACGQPAWDLPADGKLVPSLGYLAAASEAAEELAEAPKTNGWLGAGCAGKLCTVPNEKP